MLVYSIYYKLVMFFFFSLAMLGIITYEPKAKKARFEDGQTRFTMAWVYWLCTFVYAIMLIGWGLLANLHIPQIINHEFDYTTGVVQSLEIDSIENDIINYDEIVVLKDNEIIRFKGVDSPNLTKGDKVKIYEDIQYAGFVSEINGKDVLDDYDYTPITSEDSSIYIKLYYSIYMLILGCVQISLYRKNKNRYELSMNNTNRFIFGKDVEKAGFKIWKIGFILYFIFISLAVAGLATSKLAGNLTVLFCWLYLTGVWLVYTGQCRSVVYYPDGVHIQETCGYIWNYTFHQIQDIRQSKGNLYLIECKDGRTYPMNMCNENQKSVISLMRDKIGLAKEKLKELEKNELEQQEVAGLNPNIKVLKEMDTVQSQKYLIYKEADRNDVTDGAIIIVGIIGLIATIAVPFFAEELSRWTIAGIVLGLIVLMTIWKKVRKRWDDLQENVCQYVQIKMHYDEKMEFRCVDGKIIKHTFQNEVDIKDGDEVYVIYVPEINKLFAENLETMKNCM